MKKVFLAIITFLFVVSLILFYPRSVEHGIVVGGSSDTINILLKDKIKSFKTNSKFPQLTVVNFKYNILKAFSFKEVQPINERIMMKTSSYYDLEVSGDTMLSGKVLFYSVDKNNNIKITDYKSVIVGKSNIKAYKNKKNQLRTFLVFPADYTNMRVGITTTNFISNFHNKSIIKCISPAKVYSLRESLLMDIPKDSLLLVEREGTSLKLTVNNNTLTSKNRVYLKGDALSIETISRGSPSSFTPTYGGILEFNFLESGFSIINELNLEDYLKKVVPSEMPSSGGVEALKCQAVAARTYAISDMILNRFAQIGFYVDDSTRSQVYNNIETNAMATEAVDSTKGLIMTYNGEPIDAKYYSTSAGTGVDYKDVWFFADGTADNRPYIAANNYTIPQVALPKSEDNWLKFFKDASIKAVDSDYPYYRWKVEYSKKGLENSLNKTLNSLNSGETSKKYISIYKGEKKLKTLPQLENIEDIKITKRSATGIAIEVAYIFSNAAVYVRGDGYIRSSLKVHSDYTNEPAQLVRYKGNPLTNTGSLPSAFFSVEKDKDKFTIYGGGYGHGAGMSQYGAISLSKSGKKFDEILNYFYKAIKLEKLY